MKATELLQRIGKPIAYHPGLARRIGSIKACVLFCQILYWQDKTENPLGVYKTIAELEEETGLTYEEQRAARAILRRLGLVIETNQRLQHRTYFLVDSDALDALLIKPVDMGNPRSRNGKSPGREVDFPHAASKEKSTSGDGKSPRRGVGKVQAVINTEITAETTTENTAGTARSARLPRARKTAKKATAKPAKKERSETVRELQLVAEGVDLMHAKSWLTQRRVKKLPLTPAAWEQTKAEAEKAGLTPAQAVGFAAGMGWAGFKASWHARELANSAPAGMQPSGAVPEWWLSAEATRAEGARLEVSYRDDMPMPDYLVRVAKAAGRGPWIDYVLTRERKGNAQRFQQIVEFFGDALLPADFMG